MDFINFINILLVGFILLLLISGIKTIINTPKIKQINKFLENQTYIKFYGKNCYLTSIGWKKNYPSYPCKMEIYLTENEIIFIAKNSFPFIFKTIEVPFSLSRNPSETKIKTSLARVFNPKKSRVSQNSLFVEFIDNNTIKTHIEYSIDLKNSENWKTLNILNEWKN